MEILRANWPNISNLSSPEANSDVFCTNSIFIASKFR